VVVLAIIALLLLAAGVSILLRTRGLSDGATAETLGQIESYGFAARPAAAPADQPPSRPLTAFANQIGELTSRVLGIGSHGVRQQLLAAGMYEADVRTIVGYRVIAAVGLPLLGIWLAVTIGLPPLLAVLVVGGLAAAGWVLPLTMLKRRARARTELIDHELPDLIDLLVVTLEAGLSFLASLTMAAERMKGPLALELRLTLQEQRMGLAVNESLDNMLRRCETPGLRTFVRSVLQGEALGVSTGQIMRNLAVEMRKKRRANAEERAQKAPVKMLFPLVFLIFPAMFIILLGPAFYAISSVFGAG
jgi:tight adherence protein C